MKKKTGDKAEQSLLKKAKVRCGCIAVGEVQCDGCHRFLGYGERYLVIDDEKGNSQRFCFDCCLKRGHASYREEKGEKIATFFPNSQV